MTTATVTEPIELFYDERIVRVDGHVIPGITRSEFTVLAALVEEPTVVFSKDMLMTRLWGRGYGNGATTRTLDSHISRLRSKLAAPTGRRFLINVWGVGYRLRELTDDDLAELRAAD
jgi:two-component system KDP operon response regulator KdpE